MAGLRRIRPDKGNVLIKIQDDPLIPVRLDRTVKEDHGNILPVRLQTDRIGSIRRARIDNINDQEIRTPVDRILDLCILL